MKLYKRSSSGIQSLETIPVNGVAQSAASELMKIVKKRLSLHN